jgi:PAS domain S-box-containing protein
MKRVLVSKGQDGSDTLCRWGFLHRGQLLLAALVFFVVSIPARAVEPAEDKEILILNSFSDRQVDPLESLKSELQRRVPWSVNFYAEYLEGQRFNNPGYEESVVESLQRTYSAERLDLLVVWGYPALQFALRHRDELFPGVPIVFGGVSASRLVGQKMWPGVTGVTETVDVRGTTDLALSLHPKTSTVVVITNTSDFERYWLAAVHSELLRHQDKVREIDLIGPPSSQLLKDVAALPPHTIVLFQLAPQDSVHSAIGAYDVVATVGKQFPMYCIFPVLCLNHGGIGGSGADSAEVVSSTADLARRVLSGEPAETIPVVNTFSQIRVDWRQLRRWNISESALPSGSQVLYREPTFWERDRKYIVAALVLIGAQALWIVALLWQRARKRKADAALNESEGRFQRMANTTPSLVWMCNQEGKITYLNDRRIEFTGRDPNAGYDDVWTKYIHPDDVDAVLSANALGLERREKFSKQYRLRRKDGVYRWMFDVAAPRVNGDGSFAGFISSAADITDQILAKEALEKVSGQLIEAQERERSRIARDLHDDICQRLALLSMELEQVNRNGSSAATKRHVQEIQDRCSEIAGDVQALSHQLHSSKIDYLGVGAAIRGFCKEFAKQHGITIAFTEDRVPRHLAKHASLCLFRVAQEALHNAVKYSGVTQFTVELRALAKEVQLEVSDKGWGFDAEAAKFRAGLGLVSMQERVHLVHGRFAIESSPGKGTRVIATVPVVSEIAEGPATDTDSKPASMSGAA